MENILTGEVLFRPYFENDILRNTVIYRESKFSRVLADLGVQGSFINQQISTYDLGFRWRQIPRVPYFGRVIVDDTTQTVTNLCGSELKPVVSQLISLTCKDKFSRWEHLFWYFITELRVQLEPSLFNFFVKIRGYKDCNGEM
jgi:hypothetical protein